MTPDELSNAPVADRRLAPAAGQPSTLLLDGCAASGVGEPSAQTVGEFDVVRQASQFVGADGHAPPP